MTQERTDSDPPVWEIYKFTVEMADRVSARRATANSFFLTIHTALAAFVGVLAGAREASDPDPLPPTDDVAVLATALAGVVLASAWWVLLRSYRDLNSAKFEVITGIEKEHFSLRPFSQEWDALKQDPIKRWRPRYAELGFIERAVPFVFLVIYVWLGARVLF